MLKNAVLHLKLQKKKKKPLNPQHYSRQAYKYQEKKNDPRTKGKLQKLKKLSLSSRSCVHMKQVCVVINKCFATAGKENVNVLQVTAPCLSLVCVKSAYNM